MISPSHAAQHRLLQLPAVGDNAAMPTEPPEAEPPKRNRRWFQFRLRTLMIGVTLLAAACVPAELAGAAQPAKLDPNMPYRAESLQASHLRR